MDNKPNKETATELVPSIVDKVNEYFQCSDCDETYKRELKNEKRRTMKCGAYEKFINQYN